jgi:hypothetical protein
MMENGLFIFDESYSIIPVEVPSSRETPLDDNNQLTPPTNNNQPEQPNGHPAFTRPIRKAAVTGELIRRELNLR